MRVPHGSNPATLHACSCLENATIGKNGPAAPRTVLIPLKGAAMRQRSAYRSIFLALPFALSFILIGCAFGTREAMLRYPPTIEADAVPAAQAAPAPQPRTIQIHLTAFNDQRQDKTLVGTVRNGFGMRTADVIATNSVPEWVSEALTSELHNTGYTVTTRSEGSRSLAVLSGDIVNVFCDAYFTYEGKITLYVKLNKNGKDVLSRTYVGNGSAGMNWAATSDAY